MLGDYGHVKLCGRASEEIRLLGVDDIQRANWRVMLGEPRGWKGEDGETYWPNDASASRLHHPLLQPRLVVERGRGGGGGETTNASREDLRA